MKTAYFGFEADSLQNSAVTYTLPLLAPITLLGYQIDLAMGSISTPPWFGAAPFGMVLFQASTNGSVNNSDFGTAVLKQVGGTNNPTLHGNIGVSSSVFAAAILKTNPPTAVNKALIATGLSIPLNGSVVFYAGSSGYSQDFECQGVLYYE